MSDSPNKPGSPQPKPSTSLFVGKAFTVIGKQAFTPAVFGREDEFLEWLVSIRDSGWQHVKDSPFASHEFLWAVERGVVVAEIQVQWYPPTEQRICVKAIFRCSGPFMYRRFVTALLVHPSSDIAWQTIQGHSDWTGLYIERIRPERSCIPRSLPNVDAVTELKRRNAELAVALDYDGSNGVFDGKSNKQTAEEAFAKLESFGFSSVRMLNVVVDGVEKWRDPGWGSQHDSGPSKPGQANPRDKESGTATGQTAEAPVGTYSLFQFGMALTDVTASEDERKREAIGNKKDLARWWKHKTSRKPTPEFTGKQNTEYFSLSDLFDVAEAVEIIFDRDKVMSRLAGTVSE